MTDLIRTDQDGKLLDPKDRFALVHTKCNLGKKGSSLSYSIDDMGLSIDGVSNVTDEDILNAASKTVKEDVDDWLQDMLTAGPKEANAVKAAAAAKAYGRHKLSSAAARLGVVRKPSGFGGAWVWELPPTKDGAEDRTESPSQPGNEAVHTIPPSIAAQEPGGIQQNAP